MSKFVIEGGKKLAGEIQVAGSKNAILALLAASLLTDEECEFTNVPDIQDVHTMADIIKTLGARVQFNNHTLKIKAQDINKQTLPEDVGKLRGSILLIGSILARVGKVSLQYPGGDKIGVRPIDTHISALKALGAEVSLGQQIEFRAAKLKATKVVLEESSVTATENAMLAASLTEGTTTIKLAAMEPHVQQLGQFLNLMGAKVSGMGTTILTVEGVSKLKGANIEVIPDSEEAASLITLAAATKSEVTVTKLNPDFLEDYFTKLKKMQVEFEVGSDFVQVHKPKNDYLGGKIQSGLYPKLNSDYVPPMAVLATQSAGESLIYEWLYENRLGYVEQLNQMGANAQILDPHRVKITGPTSLAGAKITSYDLRMGMTLVIAALVALGESEISDIHHIDRGYERLEERLKGLGAEIKRVD